MSYIKWNKALTKHFFNENNINKEVVLYADKNLVFEIGEKYNLGNYDDFIKCILVDLEGRRKIYDDVIQSPQRSGNVLINRELSNKIKKFPNHLSTKKGKIELVYLNYIIFYITVFVENTDKNSFYQALNSIINKFIPLDNDNLSLSDLDELFQKIESWSIDNSNHGIFRARRIGALAYIGLLKYQVVLKPNENKQFEEIIYKYNIQISDNTLYAELANMLLPLIEKGTLRSKIIDATKNIVYAEWFLNRIKNFNHESFKNTEIGKGIEVIKNGQLAFFIDPVDYSLKLKTNIELTEKFNVEDCYFIESEKDENGFYIEPLIVKNSEPIKFENKWFKSNTVALKTLKINEVNFFQSQEISGGGYIQTLTPTIGYNYLIVVKENNTIISNWSNWSSNDKNISIIRRIEKNENLTNIFGNNYIFYFAEDIKKNYYQNGIDNIIYSVDIDRQSLIIKNVGGYLLTNRTYIDTALPYFEVKNQDLDFSKLKIKVYRNSKEDKDIEIVHNDNKYYLYLNNDIFINKSNLIIVKFTYNDKIEVQFDFSIVPSKIILTEEDQLYKCNKWGDKLQNEKLFFNGLNISNSSNLTLSLNKHSLEGLKNNYSFEFNYFICLLTSLFNNINNHSIKRNDISKAIDAALIFLRSKGIEIKENKYSKTNLINNLYALGYINKATDENSNSVFQLLPTTIIKIEKSFDNNSQVYKLVGARTKLMIQKTIEFCNQKNIAIKFKDVNSIKNQHLENILLPETIFIDLRNRADEFIEFIKDEINLEIKLENQHHIGDSLVNFIANINEFETHFLKSPFRFENQEFNMLSNNGLPCWVEGKMPNSKNGFLYFTKYLKTEHNSYFKDISTGWGNLYIEYKKKRSVLILKKIYGDNKNINFSPEVFISSKLRLPLIIYKALVAFNHGVPKTVKVFLKNLKDEFDIENQYYMLFDQYSISQKEGRQENIVKILTGSSDLLNNPQIVYNSNFSMKNKISYSECTLDSDTKYVVIIRNEKDQIIAIGTNYKRMFLNSVCSNEKVILKSNNILINNEKINTCEIDLSHGTLNKTISQILDNEFSNLRFLDSKRDINITTKSEEIIVIKEIQ
ncbi:hypothetical protein [Flavobacterium sp. WC2509]|uniref:hypothetical protein n=1 Tax=Flavobacterium sp. WC2509 TaxID=3461406 RepID=UPI004044597F